MHSRNCRRSRVLVRVWTVACISSIDNGENQWRVLHSAVDGFHYDFYILKRGGATHNLDLMN